MAVVHDAGEYLNTDTGNCVPCQPCSPAERQGRGEPRQGIVYLCTWNAQGERGDRWHPLDRCLTCSACSRPERGSDLDPCPTHWWEHHRYSIAQRVPKVDIRFIYRPTSRFTQTNQKMTCVLFANCACLAGDRDQCGLSRCMRSMECPRGRKVSDRQDGGATTGRQP